MDYCIDTTYLDEDVIEKIRELFEEIKCDYYLDDGYNKTEYLKDVVKIVVNCKDEKEKERIVNLCKANDKKNEELKKEKFSLTIQNKTEENTTNKKDTEENTSNKTDKEETYLSKIERKNNFFTMILEFFKRRKNATRNV